LGRDLGAFAAAAMKHVHEKSPDLPKAADKLLVRLITTQQGCPAKRVWRERERERERDIIVYS
jgi:hypothetical protein